MNFKTSQTGVILIVTLVFLLLISIVAVSGARRTLIAERVGFNHWEQERAFQAAEAALVDGAQWLGALVDIDDPEGSDSGAFGIWEQGAVQPYIYEPDYDWSHADTFGDRSGADVDLFDHHHTPPVYVVENVGWVTDDASPEHASQGFVTFYYTVTGQGHGRGEHSRAVLQTTLSKRFR